jgi:hypothetical protein
MIKIDGVCVLREHTRRRRCIIRAIAYRLALACVPFLAAGCGQGGTQTPNQPSQDHVPALKILGPGPSKHPAGLLGDWGSSHRENPLGDSDFGLHSPRQPRGGSFTLLGHRRASVDPTARYSPHKPR